jgi:hypothetical protein
VGVGIALLVSGTLLGLLVVFGAWRRLSGPVAAALLAVCGVMLGAGALLVQDAATGIEWAITLLALGSLTPLHARLVFGPAGSSA